jgi:hypothetical protein
MPAMVDGLGVGWTAGRLKIEPRERKRGARGTIHRRGEASRVLAGGKASGRGRAARAVNERHCAKGNGGCTSGCRSAGPVLRPSIYLRLSNIRNRHFRVCTHAEPAGGHEAARDDEGKSRGVNGDPRTRRLPTQDLLSFWPRPWPTMRRCCCSS